MKQDMNQHPDSTEEKNPAGSPSIHAEIRIKIAETTKAAFSEESSLCVLAGSQIFLLWR